MPPIKVCHVVKSLDPSFGGPAVSVPALCTSLQSLGVVAQIATCKDHSPYTATTSTPVFSAPVWGVPELLAVAPKLRAHLYTSDAEILHSHGLWLYIHYAAIRAARSGPKPHMISVRGMLSDWALSRSRVKKVVAWHLFQKRGLLTAACIHATSPSEVEEIRSVNIYAPVLLAPNGVDIPTFQTRPSPVEGPETAIRTALFLSRLHEIKGIPILLDAWAAARPAKWRLVIAGDGPSQYVKELHHHIERLQLDSHVSLVGPVYGKNKETLFAESSLFLLPSYSENFGMVVAEALAYAIPVITTTGTPWRELPSRNCGWWVAPNSADLSKVIAEATRCPPEMLRQMGTAGRQWMARDFSWSLQAERMLATYTWLVRGGRRPDCVIS